MDALPVLHFVFIACRFYEKASPNLWDQHRSDTRCQFRSRAGHWKRVRPLPPLDPSGNGSQDRNDRMRLTQSVQRLKGDINQAVRNWLIVIYDDVCAVGQGPNIVSTGRVDVGSQTPRVC